MNADRVRQAASLLPIVPLLMGAAVSLLAIVQELSRDDVLRERFGSAVDGWNGLAAVTAVLCLGVAARTVAGRGSSPGPWVVLRLWLYCAVLSALASLAAGPPDATVLCFALAFGHGAFALCLVIAPAVSPGVPRRVLRVVDTALFYVCFILVVGEPLLGVLARVRPSPLLALPDADPASRIDHHRYAPGTLRFGFPTNRGGHYDVEFEPKRRGERLAVAIGDSFSAGAVPHPFHFTQVAERELYGTTIYNMGVPGIGPREYLHLLGSEALPLDPDLLVINLFVGNDVVPRQRSLRSRLAPHNRLVYQVPRRLAALSREWWARGRMPKAPSGAGEDRGGPITQIDDLERRFPWVVDASLEEPVFSEHAYLELERARALTACAPSERDLEDLFRTLEEILLAAGSTPIAFLLIPDEFQVEDGLWNAMDLPVVDRYRPQRELTAWLQRRGIAHLDLLPHLRAVPQTKDGRRRVYHLRDTHWNVRGNEVAGRALAELVDSVLDGAPAPALLACCAPSAAP